MKQKTVRGRACGAAGISKRPDARRAGGVMAVVMVLLAAGLLLPVTQAQAQDSNLIRKVERLQKELNDLQRHVYKGGTPPAAGTSSGGETVGTDVSARMQLQINKMQEQMRSMNGRVEEIQHRISVMEQRLDRMSEDLELRLQQIEDAVATGGPVGRSPTAESGTGPSGTQGAAETPAAAVTLGGPAVPEGASPREQYDFAFDLLKKRDYKGAGGALQAFLDKNPDHELSGNASYWLGETYYARKEYKTAAKVFVEGYQRYPTGAKAPDNLLKLGMSLAAYGDTAKACKTYAMLLSTFPKAQARITKTAKGEQKKLKCN